MGLDHSTGLYKRAEGLVCASLWAFLVAFFFFLAQDANNWGMRKKNKVIKMTAGDKERKKNKSSWCKYCSVPFAATCMTRLRCVPCFYVDAMSPVLKGLDLSLDFPPTLRSERICVPSELLSVWTRSAAESRWWVWEHRSASVSSLALSLQGGGVFVVSQQLEVAEACVWASYAPVAIVGVGTNTLSLF